MKFWARFLKNIYKIAAMPLLKKVRPKSIESVLKNSINLLNEETASEIKNYIKKKQNPDGGFADRAGRSDLYYSLFGYFIAEAYSVPEGFHPLKKYLLDQIRKNELKGVYLYCAGVLYARLLGCDEVSEKLGIRIKSEMTSSDNMQKEYSSFLGFLALYYLEDYFAISKLISSYKNQEIKSSLPCPVIAANAILLELSGNPSKTAESQLKTFLGLNGGFKAIRNAPCEDLLSTGVALYALSFTNADIRILKPNCLSFIDDLYDNGGFRATQTDIETDVEYTFYGLLALGSLS